MNYIYDVFINLYEYPIDFYEWNFNKIINVIKVPLYKVKSIIDFKYNAIKIDKKFLDKIKNKSNVKNSCIFTDDKEAIFIKFDDEGYAKYKSKFLFEEEDDIVSYSSLLDIENIEYDIINKDNYNYSITKLGNENKEMFLKNINSSSDSKIKYLYYEYFNKKSDNIEKIKKELINNYTNIYYYL